MAGPKWLRLVLPTPPSPAEEIRQRNDPRHGVSALERAKASVWIRPFLFAVQVRRGAQD
jgi:hypothetical protein